MPKSYYNFLFFFALGLVLFSFYCALKIGLNTDEAFHHVNGAVRYLYITTLGKFDQWDVMNTRFYPGLYDTITYSLLVFFDNFINIKYAIEIKHAINWFVSSLGIFGLFILNKKIFNK